MKVKIENVYHPTNGTHLGEVKFDGFRKNRQWTALNAGGRVGDCESKEEAIAALIFAWSKEVQSESQGQFCECNPETRQCIVEGLDTACRHCGMLYE